jgi:hypothetical protein
LGIEIVRRRNMQPELIVSQMQQAHEADCGQPTHIGVSHAGAQVSDTVRFRHKDKLFSFSESCS